MTGQGSRSIRDQTKSPRLNGADLYVVRLGWKTVSNVCCEEPDVVVETVAPSRPLYRLAARRALLRLWEADHV
ncbi:hypothetical protein BDW02DRAFT_240381 [Decorospora gaudefroyi]|uniref:Uncharacterized protein n=1 Tax=Decorospora gaudefroyi TaxID=184978 RepID=A0A6A5K1M2_9PLEO|nr:hypothetical protein BDW02DRAFT_240381 [Decorospora gaudefroyi]